MENTDNNKTTNQCKDYSEKRTPLQSFFCLNSGFRLNPYDEIDEDLLRELND